MTMRELASHYHAGQYRKDGVSPYIEHPHAVVRRLQAWGCSPAMGGVFDLAWGHDLLANTAVSKEEISGVAGDEILRSIELLTFDRGRYASTADYVHVVAEQGNGIELLVMCAEQLCKTEDFVAQGDALQAARYFAEAAPLWRRLACLAAEALPAQNPAATVESLHADNAEFFRAVQTAMLDANSITRMLGMLIA